VSDTPRLMMAIEVAEMGNDELEGRMLVDPTNLGPEELNAVIDIIKKCVEQLEGIQKRMAAPAN